MHIPLFLFPIVIGGWHNEITKFMDFIRYLICHFMSLNVLHNRKSEIMKESLKATSLAMMVFANTAMAGAGEFDKVIQSLNWTNVTYEETQFQGYMFVQGLTQQGTPLSVHISKEADTYITGDVFSKLDSDGPFINHTLVAKHNIARAANTVDFKADNEKSVLMVFTDPTCGYCVRFHEKLLPMLNDRGVTVRYLAWPRGGVTQADPLAKVWCASKPQAALTAAKLGHEYVEASPSPKVCTDDVKEQYVMGVSFGVKGTPAIVLPSGMLLEGYPLQSGTHQMVETGKQLDQWLADMGVLN